MYYLHSNDTVDYNGDGVINEAIWDVTGDKKATVEDVYTYLTQNYATEGKYYDLNNDGYIDINAGEGDRNGDGIVDGNDNTYTEKQNYYWFVKDGEGNFSVVRGDRYGYQLVYNELTGYNERVQIEGIACRQDFEQTEQYKNAGFNILFIDSSVGLATSIEHSEDGANINYVTFENSLYERIMDYADELGLKCFVYGGSLHSWSSRTGSLFEDITVIEEDEDGNPTEVVSEAVFANQDELNAAVADYLKNVAAHPSFYGVSLIDEPNYAMFTAIGEVVKAITAYGDVIGKDVFIMQNLLPFARDGRSSYDGVDRSSLTYAEKADEAIYERYLTAYYEKAGQYMDMKYVQYDDYPLMVYDSRVALANFIHTHQITSDFATEKGIWRSVALQTYNNTKLDGTPYGRRAPTEYDMLWQVNVSLAFGVKEISYYTLRPIHNTAEGVYDNGSTYPLDRLGNPTPLFDAIERVNAQMNHMSAALNSFTYKGVSYYSGSTKFDAKIDSSIGTKSYTYAELLEASSVENNAMTKITSVSLGGGLTGDGLVLVSELYDEATGLYGYYVVNASSPYYDEANEIVPVSGSVTLTFDGFDAVQVWTENTAENQFLPDSGSITLDLAACEGTFIIPFNI